jgi:molybdate transport system substrate-binding protein
MANLPADMPQTIRFQLSALLLSLLLSPSAKAEVIHVICPTALAAPMKDLGESFSAQSGAQVTFTFAKIQAIQAQLEAGSKADLIILPRPEIRALEDSRVLQAGSDQPLGHVPLAIAVRADAAEPDVSTPERLRDALLAATAVAYTDPATGSGGGILAASLLNKPEFAGVHAKPVIGPASAAVIRGDAPMALQPMSELVRIGDIKIAGPVPAQLHADLDFVAVVSRGAVSETFAFLNFLKSASASNVWRRNGVKQ